MIRIGETFIWQVLTYPAACVLCILVMAGMVGTPLSAAADAQQRQTTAAEEKIWIYPSAPDPRGGRAYKLVYIVPVSVDTYWAFKTDFDNDFLVENKYIREHRFSSHTGNTVITEDKYSNGPDVFFRWRTTVDTAAHRLEFVLTNPEECGQAFHYGYIQLAAVEEGTRVTQVACFDFRGATIWAAYPWLGGMNDFLSYTARWERGTILRLKRHYAEDNK